MKKIKLKLAIYGLFIFSIIGCEKELDPISKKFRVDPDIELSMDVKNRVIEELSEVISLSISNFDVRELLHTEIEKQFDYDYDILYQFIKDHDISTENYGEVSFHDYIINLARDNNIDISNFLKYSESFITLQISSPVYFELWNYKTQIIPVISLPVDYQEALGIHVNSFHNSVKTQVLETEIHEPILLVREAERVNSKGMMRIDPDGFVLPKELQLLSARKAYEISSTTLKSRPIGSKIIVIVDDEDFESETRMFRDDIRNDKSSYNGLHNTTNTTSSDIGSTTVLKSIASISSPTSFTAYPDETPMK
ncbi:MAG: hypothetical protein P1P82_00535 [Bacteroidales bacterium]|nr:hypothetical protein [Bacteroidales bacterium]MDT8430042.1 hypothetical protein [Bacteroidales bacterium]